MSVDKMTYNLYGDIFRDGEKFLNILAYDFGANKDISELVRDTIDAHVNHLEESQLFDHVMELMPYIDQYINEDGEFDFEGLKEIFYGGAKLYYQTLVDNNIHEVYHNHAIDYINLTFCTYAEELEEIEVERIVDSFKELGDTYTTLENKIKALIRDKREETDRLFDELANELKGM